MTYMGITVVNILNETKLDFNLGIYLSKKFIKLAKEFCTQIINNKNIIYLDVIIQHYYPISKGNRGYMN